MYILPSVYKSYAISRTVTHCSILHSVKRTDMA